MPVTSAWLHLVDSVVMAQKCRFYSCNYVQTRQQSRTLYGSTRLLLQSLNHCFCLTAADPKNWQNNSLPGDPNYLVGANCVSVLIDHFWGKDVRACEDGRRRRWTHWQHSTSLCMKKTQSVPFTVPDDEGKTATTHTSCSINSFPWFEILKK